MRLMVDVGHEGIAKSMDPGAIGNGLHEATLNLYTARRAAELLAARTEGYFDSKNEPVEIRLTRYEESSLSRSERLRRIAAFNPYVCVSIHHNAYNSSARGVEIYHSAKDPHDDQLAQLLLTRIHETGMPMHGKGMLTRALTSGEDYYYIIRDVMDHDTIALLYEGCYVTNPEDAAMIKAGWLDKAALAIAKALWEFISPQLRKVDVAIQGPAVMFEGKVYPAQIIDGTTWTPVRAVSEATGLRVEYDKTTRVTTLVRR